MVLLMAIFKHATRVSVHGLHFPSRVKWRMWPVVFFFCLFVFLQIVQRRIDLLAAEGIKFINNAEVGKNVDAQQILHDNDAVLLAVGSTCPRNIPLPGNFFSHFKMKFSK